MTQEMGFVTGNYYQVCPTKFSSSETLNLSLTMPFQMSFWKKSKDVQLVLGYTQMVNNAPGESEKTLSDLIIENN